MYGALMSCKVMRMPASVRAQTAQASPEVAPLDLRNALTYLCIGVRWKLTFSTQIIAEGIGYVIGKCDMHKYSLVFYFC